MKLTAYQKRLLRTESDEIQTLSQEESYDLFLVLLQGLNKGKEFFLPDYADNATRMNEGIINVLDELDGDDAFGTEGWRRGLFGMDT